jgi:hypothetical protein
LDGFALAYDGHLDRGRLLRGEPQLEARTRPRQIDGRRLENEARLAAHAIEPVIAEHHRAGADLGLQSQAARRALGAADLEDVGEVGGKTQQQRYADGRQAMIRQAQVLEAAPVPEELRTEDVQQPARKHPLVELQIRVREVHWKEVVVLAHGRAEQQGPDLPEPQLEPRQETRALVVQALLAHAGGHDVAVGIEDGERVAVFQHPRPLVDARSGG